MVDKITTIEDVVKDLGAKREKSVVTKYVEAMKTGGIKAVDNRKACAAEFAEEKLKTGTLIDDIIGGGLGVGDTMLLFGEYGSGKSETAYTMAVLCENKVILIDTEGSFRWRRIKQICEARGIDFEKMMDKIILFQPQSWTEQMALIDNLPTPVDVGKIDIIIVDSLTKQFRGIEFAGRQELQTKQPMIRSYPIRLTEIARAYGCAVIITTQVYQTPNASSFMPVWTTFQPVGGAGLQHQPTHVIMLRKGEGNVRIARLLDSDYNPIAERPLLITEKGIEDVPDTAKAQELVKKTEQYEEKQANVMFEKTKKEKKAEILENQPTEEPQPTEEV